MTLPTWARFPHWGRVFGVSCTKQLNVEFLFIIYLFMSGE